MDVVLATFPKVELHVHLEGTISFDTLRFLANKYNIKTPHDPYKFHDFYGFIDRFGQVIQFLREPSDYFLITKHYPRGLY